MTTKAEIKLKTKKKDLIYWMTVDGDKEGVLEEMNTYLGMAIHYLNDLGVTVTDELLENRIVELILIHSLTDSTLSLLSPSRIENYFEVCVVDQEIKITKR